MNIFYLSHCPHTSAHWMVDKHIVKMPLESCQMLSTAHRLLDGRLEVHEQKSGRTKKFYLLSGEKVVRTGDRFIIENQVCYYPTHANHPSTAWTMASKENYEFHVDFLMAMTDEYARRYGRIYKSVKTVLPFLFYAPNNLRSGRYTDPTPAMPDCYKVPGDTVQSYRNYYAGSKWRFAQWKHGKIPPWFLSRVAEMWDHGDPVQRIQDVDKILAKKTPPSHPDVMEMVRNLRESHVSSTLLERAHALSLQVTA